MYDRILALLTETSKATRAKIAAMGGRAAFKQAAGAQKPDQLAMAQPGGVKAAADRLKGRDRLPQGQMPRVGIGSRKVGMGSTGRSGGRQPRAPISTVLGSIKRGTSDAQKAVPTTAASAPMSTTARRRLQGAAFKVANRQRQAAALAASQAAAKPAQPAQSTIQIADRPKVKTARMRARAGQPTVSSQRRAPQGGGADRASGPAAGSIQRALQGGGTTITQLGLKKLSPFLQAGLRTRPVKPVI